MMKRSKFFFSLKWKFALSLGVTLVLLYGVYSYYIYEQTEQNFMNARVVTQNNQINAARTLTEGAFLDLDRFIESVVLMPNKNNESQEVGFISLFDKNWMHWQAIWGLEHAVFYDYKNDVVRHWGKNIETDIEVIQKTFFEETPQHEVICERGCFQQITTPVLFNSKVIGVLSVSVSLSDVLLQYKSMMHSNLGLLMTENNRNFSSVTKFKQNHQLWKKVRKKYRLDDFIDQSVVFKQGDERYEFRAFSVSPQKKSAPYYIIINDISIEYKKLQNKVFLLGFRGFMGLLVVILILFTNLHFIFIRIMILSKALPLLVKHRYDEFNTKIKIQQKSFFLDEVDVLSKIAISVASELEVLADNVQRNTEDLKGERDFIGRLIDKAPILIVTHDIEGKILMVNREGLDNLLVLPIDIVGKDFSILIPKSDVQHLEGLEALRVQEDVNEFIFEGELAIKSGAVTYIAWTHTLIDVKSSSKNSVVLSLGIDITEQKKSNEKLIWVANHDSLTGLKNRRYFQQELDTLLLQAARNDEQLALFYLDLDQFKIINDKHGHQSGDGLLQTITSILNAQIEAPNILSRIGGDEFTVIVPETNMEVIENLLKILLQSLRGLKYEIDGQPHLVSFSVGVAIYPQHGTTREQLLTHADLAMYYAKKTGGASYHIFLPDFEYQASLTQQLRWKSIIEYAIQYDEFVLYYQPILDIKAKKISHYECLVRIQKKDGSMLMPGDFIPYAEELGLIDKIDYIVLQKAIEQHLRFQEMGNNVRLAINLSGRSMNDMDLFTYIEGLLNQPGVKPDCLIFEITETSAVSNFLSAQTMIKQLKALGCYFALDDFGVGFSSFYYLKSLPVDYVKIDGSFVKHMDVSEEDQIFVKVLTEVSQAFGKKIIAEYVENIDILNLLNEQGVDYAQGYYVSKPLADPLDLDHVKGLH